MDKGNSLYLDLLRFSAAMVVFFSHVASQDLTDGFLWQFKAYSQTAVMIFFVMSGYVIAYVTEEKEKSFSSFSIARISRLYSVIIPALILTAVCDFIGLNINAPLYMQSSWHYPEGSQLMHYFLTFFLVQNIWELELNPGINGPFWSLTYEWMYYILFGVFYFFKSHMKWLAIVLLMVISGPSIVALFPIWLMGFWLFKLQKTNVIATDKLYIKAVLSVVAIGLLLYLSPMIRGISFTIPLIERTSILGDYFDALLFTVHLYFSRYLVILVFPILLKYEKIIRWSASLTFALYLFHRPIIQLFAALYDGDQSNNFYRVSMVVVTFCITATVGRWCEQHKYMLKKLLENSLAKSKWSYKKI